LKKKPLPKREPIPGFEANEYIGVPELARILNVPEATVRTMRKAGEMPPSFRLGTRLIRFRVADVKAWLAMLEQGVEA
jgi:excisionase family DNA binding protein